MRMTVLVVPVAVGVPAALVFIPPAVIGGVTVFASLAQLVARVRGLPAVPAVMFDGLVKAVVGSGDAVLTLILIRACVRRGGEKQHSSECGAGHQQLSELDNSSTMICFHRFSIILRVISG